MKSREELVKKVWGQGRDRSVFKNDHHMFHATSGHKPHMHTYSYMWCIIYIELQ